MFLFWASVFWVFVVVPGLCWFLPKFFLLSIVFKGLVTCWKWFENLSKSFQESGEGWSPSWTPRGWSGAKVGVSMLRGAGDSLI